MTKYIYIRTMDKWN